MTIMGLIETRATDRGPGSYFRETPEAFKTL